MQRKATRRGACCGRRSTHTRCFNKPASTGILRRRSSGAAKIAVAMAGTIADVPVFAHITRRLRAFDDVDLNGPAPHLCAASRYRSWSARHVLQRDLASGFFAKPRSCCTATVIGVRCLRIRGTRAGACFSKPAAVPASSRRDRHCCERKCQYRSAEVSTASGSVNIVQLRIFLAKQSTRSANAKP